MNRFRDEIPALKAASGKLRHQCDPNIRPDHRGHNLNGVNFGDRRSRIHPQIASPARVARHYQISGKHAVNQMCWPRPRTKATELFFIEWIQDHAATDRPGSLVFDWQTTGRRLAAAVSDEDGRRRIVLEAPSMPTMELSMERLLARNSSWTLRTTENQIVAIVSGRGRTKEPAI